MQHKYAPNIDVEGRGFNDVPNTTKAWQPTHHNCTAAFLMNPYMGLTWIAVPCNENMPNVLNVCEEDLSKDQNPTPQWSNMITACPKNFISSNNACFSLSFEKQCSKCRNESVGTCTCLEDNFSNQPQLLNLWGLSRRILYWPDQGRLYLRGLENAPLLFPKLVSRWGQNLSSSLEKVATIHFDIIKVSENPLYLFKTDTISTRDCLSVHFQCQSGSCVLLKYVCDGESHCYGGEDEVNCNETVNGMRPEIHGSGWYSNGMWICDGSKYVPLLKICDFHFDCLDNSDEVWCIHSFCESNAFQCTNGQCISLKHRCDQKQDCVDGSDEQDCGLNWLNTFRCDTKQLVPLSQVHDLFPDCENAEDEADTLKEMEEWSSNLATLSPCREPNMLPCVHGTSVCYPPWAVCLFDHDDYGVLRFCRNGGHLSNCAEMQCIGTFKCPGSYCLPLHKICNGQNDCHGGADERECENYVCPPGALGCAKSNICVHQHQVCDGIKQCPLADDEKYCLSNDCPDSCLCTRGKAECISIHGFPAFSVYMRSVVITGNIETFVFDKELIGQYILHLNVTNVPIPQISHSLFNGIPNVQKLSVVAGIQVILSNAFISIQNLRHLRLDHNPIMKIEPSGFAGITHLVFLNLSRTLITRLDSNIFAGQNSLRLFIIANTPLFYVSWAVFQDTDDLQVFDARGTQLVVSTETVNMLAHLPATCLIKLDDRLLCMIAIEIGLSCHGVNHGLPEVVSSLGVVTVRLIVTVVAVFCSAESLFWHGRLLAVPYSFLTFHLVLSDTGIVIHSLLLSAHTLRPQILHGSLFAIFHWTHNWACYLATSLFQVALIQSQVVLCIFSAKRCLAIIRPLSFRMLRIQHLQSVVYFGWFFSAVVVAAHWVSHALSARRVANNSLTSTTVFCLPFTQAQQHPIFRYISYSLHVLLSLSVISVMLASASLIIHKKTAAPKLRKSRPATKGQLISLVAKLVLEAVAVSVAFGLIVLAFTFHLDLNVGTLEVFITEAAILAGLFRINLGCTLHTLSTIFKTYCLAHCVSCNNISN